MLLNHWKKPHVGVGDWRFVNLLGALKLSDLNYIHTPIPFSVLEQIWGYN